MTKKMTIELPPNVYVATIHRNVPDGLEFATPEAADELIKRVEAAKAKRPAGMPEEGQCIYFIGSYGEKEWVYWKSSDSACIMLQEIGNVFLTEAECQKEIERRKALQRVRQWIVENTEPFEPDWESDEQEKFMVYFDHKSKQMKLTVEWTAQYFDGIAWLASKEDAKRLIESCEADLRTLAGVE